MCDHIFTIYYLYHYFPSHPLYKPTAAAGKKKNKTQQKPSHAEA